MMKNLIVYISILFLFLGCALQDQVNLLLPKEDRVIVKNNQEHSVEKEKRRDLKTNCKKDFTEVTIDTYQENSGRYFFDISSFEGRRDRIPLNVYRKNKFKPEEFKKCFISPAAWLIITQPERFEFFIDKDGDFRYKTANNSN